MPCPLFLAYSLCQTSYRLLELSPSQKRRLPDRVGKRSFMAGYGRRYPRSASGGFRGGPATPPTARRVGRAAEIGRVETVPPAFARRKPAIERGRTRPWQIKMDGDLDRWLVAVPVRTRESTHGRRPSREQKQRLGTRVSVPISENAMLRTLGHLLVVRRGPKHESPSSRLSHVQIEFPQGNLDII